MKDIKNNYFNINWEKVLLGELNGEIELISKSLEKYDCFSIKQKALIYETIVSSIELEYSKYKSNRMNSAFDVDARIEVLFELPNRVTEYIISIFTFVNDAKSKYPTIIKNIENNDSLSFEILQKYLENECAEYINLSVGEIVKEDNEIVKEILNGRKEAFSAQKTMDRFKRIKFKECEIKNSIDYLEWLKEWTPEKIVSHLNQYIIGQKNAKEGAATALVAHMQRIAYPELSLNKKNMLFYGPSGCGKTAIWKALKLISPVDICIQDISNLTEPGFQGIEVNELLSSISNSNSIVVFDEFDKICKIDISKEGRRCNEVKQGCLLNMIDSILVKGDRGRSINTADLTFIFLRVFDIAPKEETKVCGFLSENTREQSKETTIEDFINFGVIPELLGRLSGIEKLEKLSENDYLNILRNAKGNALEDFKKIYKLMGIEVDVSDDAILEIAKHLPNNPLGVRRINSILYNALSHQYFTVIENREAKIKIEKTDVFEILSKS